MGVSGVLRRRDGNIRAGNANLAFSGLMLAGTLASILIPEKTPEQIQAAGEKDTLLGKIEQQPLSYVRWLFFAGDALAGVEALGEFQAAKKLPKGNAYRPWQFGMSALSLLAMGTFLGGDWLTGAGSKKASGKAEESSAAQETLLTHAAQIIASQPVEAQQKLAQSTAAYLIQQNELRLIDRKPADLAAEILASIHARVPQHDTAMGEHTAKLQTEIAAPEGVGR